MSVATLSERLVGKWCTNNMEVPAVVVAIVESSGTLFAVINDDANGATELVNTENTVFFDTKESLIGE